MASKDWNRAMGLAREYRRLRDLGRVGEAEMVRRTIEDFGVGSYVDGRYVLAEAVRREMGLVQS